MLGLGDLFQSFPHPSLVGEEAAAPHSVFVSVLFPFLPLIKRLPWILSLRSEGSCLKSQHQEGGDRPIPGAHSLFQSPLPYLVSSRLVRLPTEQNVMAPKECDTED